MTEPQSDMARLFAEDPLHLTSGSFHDAWVKEKGMRPIESIIEYYRKARANFNLGEKSAGSTKKAKAVKADPNAPKLGLDALKDLLG